MRVEPLGGVWLEECVGGGGTIWGGEGRICRTLHNYTPLKYPPGQTAQFAITQWAQNWTITH